MRSQQGATLVEAGMITAIAAITLSTATPGLQRLVEARRLEGVAAQAASDMQFARSEAVLRQHALRFSLHTATWGGCWVVHTGAADDCECGESGPARCAGDARALKTVQVPASDRITLNADVDSMLFDPLHGTSTPAGTLEIVAASGRAIRHVVNVMGRVRSCAPDAAMPGLRAC